MKLQGVALEAQKSKILHYSPNTKSVYIIDKGTGGTNTLSGTRQSGDTLTTGQQNYTLDESASSSVRGGVNIRGGTILQ
jgi:hypothetical protein